MNPYLVTINGTHRATGQEFVGVFIAVAESADGAVDDVLSEHNLSGIDNMQTPIVQACKHLTMFIGGSHYAIRR